jgi:putative phosphoribosyl transferase
MTVPLPFLDRAQAGRLLADRLSGHDLRGAIVYALPRGGVPVAFEIALRLDAPLDLVLVRKIGAPGQPELALAAVVDGDHPRLVVNEVVRRATHATSAYLEEGRLRELAEIERRRKLYFGSRRRPDPNGKTAIVVDDGLATGSTALAAIQALRDQGAARLILAVPVAPADTAAEMRMAVDDLVCLAEPEVFRGVGAFYVDFHQLDDREVLGLLARSEAFGGAQTGNAGEP